jgi:hypothetical protein
MSEVPYEKHRISCTSNLKTPEWTRAQYRKHLTGWALGFKPLFRQCSMTRTSNQLNFHHNDYEYLKFCHKKVLLTEFLLGKNLISRSSFESTHLYLHVTFHVQEYKQVHNRISLHMTLFLAEEGIFGFRTDLLPPPIDISRLDCLCLSHIQPFSEKTFRFLRSDSPRPPPQTFSAPATFVLTRYNDLEKKKKNSIFRRSDPPNPPSRHFWHQLPLF